MKANDNLYPIREVSLLTGVNSITLRAWERRYGLVEPVRTEGGHRLYTPEHIEQIKAAVKLTQEGIPISQVKVRLEDAVVEVKEKTRKLGYDYLSRTVEASLQFDLEALSYELDSLFQDVSDKWRFKLLREATQLLSEQSSAAVSAFWESQLLPRLYTQINFAFRQPSFSASKKLWLQNCHANRSSVIPVLVALRLAEQGFHCVLSRESEMSDETLFDSIKASQSLGLVVVDENQDFDHSRWQDWIAKHPGLEFHYFVEDPNQYEIGAALQCYGYKL